MNTQKATPTGTHVLALLIGLLVSFGAYAHHILGVPHYNYDEAYPQTPILTMKAEAHGFIIEMTANPGKPMPNERCSLHVYIRDEHTGVVLDDAVTLTVERARTLRPTELTYGPMEGELEEAMYKFFPEFEIAGNYDVLVSFTANGEQWVVEMPMTVGEPASPWTAAGIALGSIAALLVVARAILIKRKRRAATTQPSASGNMQPGVSS